MCGEVEAIDLVVAALVFLEGIRQQDGGERSELEEKQL